MFQPPAPSSDAANAERDRDRRSLNAKRRHGGDEDGAPSKETRPRTDADPEAEVPVARLDAVEILNGGDGIVLAGNSFQYVNLPREDRWVDGPVGNIDRLGARLRVRIRFDAPGGHRFWARLHADGGNAVYSPTELAQPGFGCDLGEHEYQTAGDGTLLIEQDFVLPAAGGNTFWISARDEADTQLFSYRLATRRLLYCQELVMEQAPAAPNLNNAVATFAAQHMILVPLPRVALPHRANVDVEDGDQHAWLLAAMDAAFLASEGAAKAPFVFVVAYVINLALKGRIQLRKDNVSVGPAQPDVTLPVLRGGQARYLWKAIDGMDWPGPVRFAPAGGDARGVTELAPVTAVPNDHHYPDQCRNIRVKVSGIAKEQEVGRLTLGVSIVERLLGGVSFGNASPRICLATRAGWTGVTAPKQEAIVLHEIGHKIGMVPDGLGNLDRLALQYDGNGHVGSHCHAGVPADFGLFHIGTCVMFGEAVGPNQAFCDACANAVRKADLSTGWPL